MAGSFQLIKKNIFVARYKRGFWNMLGKFLTLFRKRITTKLPQQSLQAQLTA